MSTHNICFCGEIKKLSVLFVEKKSTFSGATCWFPHGIKGKIIDKIPRKVSNVEEALTHTSNQCIQKFKNGDINPCPAE